jgi:hypothetical protein
MGVELIAGIEMRMGQGGVGGDVEAELMAGIEMVVQLRERGSVESRHRRWNWLEELRARRTG